MKKILYTRSKVSVHHIPNSQTFARKQPIINLLHHNLSKALTHSGMIPFYFQQHQNRNKLYKNSPQPNSSKHQSIPLNSNSVLHVQLHIFQAPYFIQQTYQLRTRLFNAIKHI